MAIDRNLAAAKYAQNTPAAAGVWAQRTQGAANVWEQNAKSPAADAAWKEGITQAVANNARMRGLSAVTASDFAQGVQAGSATYAQKTAQSAGKLVAKSERYYQVLDRVVPSLPPRGPAGSPQNYDRVRAVGEALHNEKIGGVAAGAGFAPARAPAQVAPLRRF